MAWPSEQIAILDSGRFRLGGLVRVATPSPVRLWTGIGDLPIVDSAFDADNDIYKGGPRLITMPAFQRMFNGLAERITISLNGVSPAMRDLAYDERADIKGAIFRLGLVILDDDYQQEGDVQWLRRGRIDVIEISSDAGNNGERIRTLEFSVGSFFTGRKELQPGTWTQADQQSRPGSEDDRFCEWTSMLFGEKRWPS
jgi:hypothetical protein